MTHQELLDRMEEEEHDKVALDSCASVWVQRSQSDPTGLYYIIRTSVEGDLICTCKGWRYTDGCRHIEEMKKLL